MALQRPIFQSFRQPLKITHIFLGIDFGTSFTKVSYSYSYATNKQIQIHTLKWSNLKWEKGFVTPTILYLKDNKLFFEKPEKDCLDIRYFKYSILEESLLNNHQNTKNRFEEMCCVYFLAQIIKRSFIEIQKQLKIENLDELEISVNMGAPLENFYNEKEKPNKELYLEILENAITLAGGSKVKATLPDNSVLLDNLDEVYTELSNKKPELNWKAAVIPELAAELFLYQQSKFIPEGLYIIIDIGGGTVDMAIFEKYKFKHDVEAGMYCIAQKVLPYGVEILESENSNISSKEFQDAFITMVMSTKHRMDVHYEDLKKVDVFFLGGGANNDWYRKNIINTQYGLEKSFGPKLSFKQSINDFIKTDETLLERNQRLIISQMIAKDENDITKVLGYPNFYDEIIKDNIREANLAYEDELYERGSRYWD